MKKVLLSLFFAFVNAFGATSVTQYGITWTFDTNYTTGQYANGDYYVVAPSGLTITSISPASTVSAGRTINGSMVNPVAGPTAAHGFDSSVSSYSAALNAARPGGSDLSVGNPLVLAAGSSLISSISVATAGARPILSDAAVLTVVSSAPPANSFRPPYCGTDKSHNWNKSGLNYSILGTYAAVFGSGTPSSVEGYFARPWIEINTQVDGRYIHPSNNQPDYGGNMAIEVGDAALILNFNYTNAEKETLYVRLVQYGIDVYGAAKNGADWQNNGGHNIGRKLPLVLAGLAFSDSNILAYADASLHFIFQEDQQTYYVAAGDIANTPSISDGRPRAPYTVRSAAVTITTGSTTRVNWTSHGFYGNEPVRFSGGTIPTGMSAGVDYFVKPETIAATSIFAGQAVSISTPGTTDFTLIGAPNSSAGTFFIATGPGTGTGTVSGMPQNSFLITRKYGDSALVTSGSGSTTGTFNATGLAEWGEKHTSTLSRDGANWNTFYRDVNWYPVIEIALAAQLIDGAVDAWNWPAFFDYYDRVKSNVVDSQFSTTLNNAWAAYRFPSGTPPTAPSSLSVTGANFSTISLSWTDNATDESYFEIQASATSGSGFAQVGTASASTGTGTVTYTVSGLPSGTLRYFRVRAVNAGGNSAWTSEASGTTWAYGVPQSNRRPAKALRNFGGL